MKNTKFPQNVLAFFPSARTVYLWLYVQLFAGGLYACIGISQEKTWITHMLFKIDD